MKFIGYIPFGYPNIEKSIEIVETYVAAGCKSLEISFPTYDPVDESEMITEYMRKALSNCNDYEKYMTGIQCVRDKHPNLEINLLMFVDIIDQIGLEKLCSFYTKNRIACIICPDIDTNKELKAYLVGNGIKFSSPVHYDFTEAEIKNCLNNDGFVYVQAFPTKGQKVIEGYDTPDKIISYLKRVGVKQPIYAGVGIKTVEDVQLIKAAGADGFFVGGTPMRIMEDDSLQLAIKQFIDAGK